MAARQGRGRRAARRVLQHGVRHPRTAADLLRRPRRARRRPPQGRGRARRPARRRRPALHGRLLPPGDRQVRPPDRGLPARRPRGCRARPRGRLGHGRARRRDDRGGGLAQGRGGRNRRRPALPARGRLAHRCALRRRPRASHPPGAAARRRRRPRAGGARDRAERLPPERGALRVPPARAAARARRRRRRDRRRARVDQALLRVHDAHARAGGQRGLRRGARRPLRRRSRRRGRARPRAPARARPLRRRARLRPDALRAATLRLCQRRLRPARRGRARDVGTALARAGDADRPHHERRPSRHLARPRPGRAAALRGRASRGAARRGELGGGPRGAVRGGLARARRRQGAAGGARGDRPRPADDRLRAALRDLQARGPRLLGRRAVARAADPDRRRRQGASGRRAGQGRDAGDRRSRPRPACAGPHRLPRELRHGRRARARPRLRRLAEHAPATARGVGDERDEGGRERRPQPLRARRLVGGGVLARRRLGDRRRLRRCRPRAALPAARGAGRADLHRQPRALDRDDEGVDRASSRRASRCSAP